MTPEGWVQPPLRELLAAVTTGVSVNSENRPSSTGEIGVLRTSAVTYGVFRPTENKAVLREDIHRARETPRAGCVLLSRMNTQALVGASAYVDRNWPDLVLPDRIWQLEPLRTSTDGRWLSHYLSAPTTRTALSELASGTSGSMKNLSQEKFLAMQIVLPPLAEQRKIAAILSSVDDAIESTQAVIDQLGVVKKAMMAELLTRGLPGRHTRFKQTEIGEVPEDWEVTEIGGLVESCDYGLSKSLSASPVGVAVLRMGNLVGGRVVLGDLKYIDSKEVTPTLLLHPGDVLFNRTNSKDLVGKVGMFSGSDLAVSFASYLLRLRPKRDCRGEWLAFVMNLESHQADLRAMATPGVSQVNINRTKMLSLKVPVPPAAEQEELVDVLRAVEGRERTERDVLHQFRRVKEGLMSVLLTGELRVRPDEDAA